MKKLEGKTVLITGGASGIGKIMVRLMLERKAKVIIWDINQEKINETIFHLFGTIVDFRQRNLPHFCPINFEKKKKNTESCSYQIK